MFDLMKIQPVLNHLKSISTIFEHKGNEIVMFCPYCDDATRANPKHGHCYVATNFPVFNCFRCDSSGTLIRLLMDTGFQDEDTLKYLSSFIKYKFLPDYYQKTKKKVLKSAETYKDITELNLKFKLNNRQNFEMFHQYLKDRLGDIDYTKFLISPGQFYKKLTCDFYNTNKELITQRLIEKLLFKEKEVRYHLIKESSGLYYFQDLDFENKNQITLAEGPFDIISLYLYNPDFKNNIFICADGKKYISTVEKLLIEELLIGNYQINLVFDNDVKNYNTFIYKCNQLCQMYNNKVTIKGWLPIMKKDTADFPAVTEIVQGGYFARGSKKR